MNEAPRDLYFEQVEIGSVYVTESHEVTVEDIERFCELTLDRHPVHTDEAVARSFGFPGLITHGLFNLSLMEGLKTRLHLFTNTGVASLGWDEVQFLKPVVAGDTLRTRVRFLRKRLAQGGGRGIVIEQVELLNQRDEIVLSGKHSLFAVCRGDGEAKEGG